MILQTCQGHLPPLQDITRTVSALFVEHETYIKRHQVQLIHLAENAVY